MVSEAQKKASKQYITNKLDEIKIRVPKGKKNILQEIAQSQGESLNNYTKLALKAKIKADTGENIEL